MGGVLGLLDGTKVTRNTRAIGLGAGDIRAANDTDGNKGSGRDTLSDKEGGKVFRYIGRVFSQRA